MTPAELIAQAIVAKTPREARELLRLAELEMQGTLRGARARQRRETFDTACEVLRDRHASNVDAPAPDPWTPGRYAGD